MVKRKKGQQEIDDALLKAAGNGNTPQIAVLVGQGASVNGAVGEYGLTALMIAAENGHTDTVNALVGSHGANVDAVDPEGFTALMEAAKEGYTDTVNALAGTHNANVDAASNDGSTALMLAAIYGHIDTVNALAGTHNANVDAADVDGLTSLMFAARNGHTDTVNALVLHGADVEAVNGERLTASMMAANLGHKAVVKALAGFGGHSDDCDSYQTHDSDDSYDAYDDSHDGSCDYPSCWSSYCNCALCNLMRNLEDGDHFQAKKSIEALNLDVNKPIEGEGRTPLMIACEYGHSNLVDMLVKDLKSNVNAANSKGQTALMFAAQSKMVKMVMTLVNKHKAKVDAEDKTGLTALFYAINASHVDVVNVLLGTCKANVEHRVKGEQGLRPLMAATLGGEVDILNLLCSRHKANPNGKDDYGQTALMLACSKGNAGVVQALAGRHKASVDIRSKEGMMALHYAAQCGRHEIVDMLLGKYGADVEARTAQVDPFCRSGFCCDRTALHFAVNSERLDTVKVLVNKYDASPAAVDGFGKTPLEYAKEKGNEAIIKVLSDRRFVVFVRATGEGHTTSKEEDGKECEKNEESQGDVRLRINTSTKAQRVIDAFCTKKGWKSEDIAVSFKGKELSITANTTIGDLGLERNDCIDASLRISLQDLHNAVIKGDIAGIKRIIDMKAVDLNGMLGGQTALSALMLSIYCDKPKALQTLLELGADVDATNEKGWTALWVATQDKRPSSTSMFRELLEHRPCLETVDQEHGWTVLFLAVMKDSVEHAKALVSAGASVTATDKAGKTPLDHAREMGNQEMIALLEAAKLNPARPYPDSSLVNGGQKGQSPSAEEAARLALECEETERARKQREDELARKLAEEEEALNRKFAEEARKRAEEEAQQAKQRAIVEEVQRKAAAEEKARIEAFKARKRAEDEERRRKLEEEQAAMRKRDMALKKALEKEEKALRKQKKKEAEQEAKVKLRALVQEKEEHVKAKARAEPPRVLRRPANDAPMSSDFNPTDPIELLIKFAAKGDMLNITHLINHENVDANARHPKTGITAVMAAARHGRGGTVKSLVKKKAVIEAFDNEGRTALMHAIMGNQPGMVKDLLDQHHADLSATDNSGETPLSMAENLGLDTIVEHLKAHKKRLSHIRDQGKPDKPTNPVSDKPDQPKTSDRHDDSRFFHAMHPPGGFFGDLSANTGLVLGLDTALEDGLDAPAEEVLPGEETYDPIANGRDEWLHSMFSLDIDDGAHNTEDIMEDLLKEVNDITIESCDEINLVAEDVPMPFSNVGLGGLLASAPAPSDNLIPASGLIESMAGRNLFGPMLLTPTDPNPAERPPVLMTAGEIESRLRMPAGFDRSSYKLGASIRGMGREQEREWTALLEKKVEKLDNFRTDTKNRLKTLTKERDSLIKQVRIQDRRLAAYEKRMSNQDKRLAAYEKRMKSMERRIDQLLDTVKQTSQEANSALR